eukprot:48823-Eustigmatos_ZCMA.PRE.1
MTSDEQVIPICRTSTHVVLSGNRSMRGLSVDKILLSSICQLCVVLSLACFSYVIVNGNNFRHKTWPGLWRGMITSMKSFRTNKDEWNLSLWWVPEMVGTMVAVGALIILLYILICTVAVIRDVASRLEDRIHKGRLANVDAILEDLFGFQHAQDMCTRSYSPILTLWVAVNLVAGTVSATGAL